MAHIDNKPITIDHIQTWIFDLDNTIYPAASRLFDQVRHRMTDYIQHHFLLERDAARAMQRDLFLRHRTTMKGLMVEHGTDPHHFMDYVHDIDLSTLGYDTELNEGIGALSGRKVIFTNGSAAHAANILEAYGIRHHFDFTYDIFSAGFLPKPEPKTYADFMQKADINPHTAIMVEDMAINLKPAHDMGVTTLWLDHPDEDVPSEGRMDDVSHINYIADDLKHFLSYTNI
jgi:putative hydrolase of the HAD superfamily